MFLYTNNKGIWKGNKEDKPIYNGIKTNIVLRNKFSQWNERTLHWKQEDMDERNGKKQINGKISCVYVLEELILLKFSYCLKPSIDWMQSGSNVQWHCSLI